MSVVVAVAMLIAAGVLAATAAQTSGPFGPLWLPALIVVVTTISWIWPLRIYRGDVTHGIQLDDGLLVVALLLVSPQATVTAFTAATAVAVIAHRLPLPKALFNLAQYTAGAGIAVLVDLGVAEALNVAPDSPAPAVAGAAAFAIFTHLAVAVAISFAERLPLGELLARDLAFRVLFWSASVCLGLLVGLSAQNDLRSLMFSLIPLLVLHLALAGHRQANIDRERISGLLEATIAAYGSTRVPEVQEAVVVAARHLLQANEAGIGLARPDDSLAVRLSGTDGTLQWLWVADRWDGAPFDSSNRRLLEALASVAGGALENARLVEEIQRQAFHDSLTGLPNHVLFGERLSSALAAARDSGTKLAVAFIDIDRFKGVNDSLGHSAGDYLLVDLADRLADDLRPGDTVARLGGDEFTVLWTGLDDVDDARWRCEEVLARLREPVRLRGQQLFVTGSMGVAVFPHDGTTAQVLVRRADLAMYEAKRSGRNAYRFWVRAHDASLPDLRREGELHAAIDGRELVVHYQPVIDLATGQIRSVEALARWNHPVAGLLPPEEFIGLAEELGLVTLIDGWVLQHATEQMAAWHRAGLDHISLAVNISAHRFEDLSFIELVASQLERTGLAPSALQLEMTESVAIRDATDTILKLSELGVSLVMDDFGTGYSMLSRLRSFPLDALKIDRSFMSDDPDDQALVEAIISMGRSLGLEVVAEGVESLEQHVRLRRLGCHLAQGFFYSKPMAAEEIEPVLRAGLDLPAVRPDVP